jgi:biopolymer transport protein TolR|tara:strand:- start:42 stop:464 length:423 start_codon:yes stop_codon:yes gene_type:complete
MAKSKNRPMAQINVVPYIDVMLVLLVIFMVTAPMLAEGVKVDLPQASAQPLPNKESKYIVVTVDAVGDYWISLGNEQAERVSSLQIEEYVLAYRESEPGADVVVRGHEQVAYGKVIELMAALTNAGVPSVGLATEAADTP